MHKNQMSNKYPTHTKMIEAYMYYTYDHTRAGQAS